MLDLGTAVGYLMLDTSKFQSGFKSALNDLKTFQDSTASVTDKTKALSSAMTTTGQTLTKNVTLPLVGIGTAAVATTAKFDSSMSNLQAISGATGTEIDSLRDKAKEMGAKTKFSASEAADAFTYMAMAGWKTGDMLDGIEGIMNLAAASGEDLASTSDIVTDALTAFGLSASDSGHFADVLAAASNNANTNVSMLGESFKYVAPVAGSLGYSVEDVSVALGLMANSGIKASQAGTSLRSALTRMIKPTDTMASYMKQLGIMTQDGVVTAMTNADGSMKPLSETMQILREKFDGLTEAQKAEYAAAIFGQESMSGMLAIINASDEDFDKLTESINNAGGTAQNMADTQLDNLTGQLTILKSTLESIAISIGEILMPYIRDFVAWLQKLALWLANASDEQKEFVVKVAAIAAAIGPILLIGGKIAGVISTVMKLGSTISGLFAEGGALAGLGTAVSGLAGPIAIVIAAVVGLVAAWKTNFGHIQEYTADAVESIKGIFTSIKDFIVSVVSGVIGIVKTAWENDFLGIQEAVEFFHSLVENAFEQVLDTISSALEIINQLLQGDFSGAFETLVGYLQDTWERIKEVFSSFGDWISEAWSQIWTAVADFFKSIWDSIVQWIQEKVDQVIQFFTETLPEGIDSGIQTLSEIPGKVAAFISQLPEVIGYHIGLALGKMAAWAVDMATKAKETGTNVLNGIVQFFTQLPGAISNFCSSAFNSFTSWASNMWNKAKETGSNVLNGIVQFLSQLPGKIADVVSQALAKFQTFVTGLPQKAKQAAKEAANAVLNGLKALPGQVASLGSQIVSGLWNGIKGSLGALKSNIIGFCKSVVSGFKAGFGIHSPSREMIPLGKYLMQGLEVGMEEQTPKTSKQASDLAGNVVDTFDSAFSSMSSDSGVEYIIAPIVALIQSYKDLLSRSSNMVSNIDLQTEAYRRLAEQMNLVSSAQKTLADSQFSSISVQDKSAQQREIAFSMQRAQSMQQSQKDVVINITTTLDGAIIARNQYKHNINESQIRGTNLVQGK